MHFLLLCKATTRFGDRNLSHAKHFSTKINALLVQIAITWWFSRTPEIIHNLLTWQDKYVQIKWCSSCRLTKMQHHLHMPTLCLIWNKTLRKGFEWETTFWKIHNSVFKTSSRRLRRQKIITLKTSYRRLEDMSWRHILKTSSRPLGGKQNIYWWYVYLINLNVYLTNLCFTNLYLTNLRRIQNALVRNQ